MTYRGRPAGRDLVEGAERNRNGRERQHSCRFEHGGNPAVRSTRVKAGPKFAQMEILQKCSGASVCYARAIPTPSTRRHVTDHAFPAVPRFKGMPMCKTEPVFHEQWYPETELAMLEAATKLVKRLQARSSK